MLIIALIDEQPPSTLPRHAGRRRPSRPGSGSDSSGHTYFGSVATRVKAMGMGPKRWSSLRPASSSSTLTFGSSLRRAATTQPAEPAPTTM